MADNMNLWIYWAKRLHLIDTDNREWWGYCDEVCGMEGNGLVLETKEGYILFGRSQIRMIETVA